MQESEAAMARTRQMGELNEPQQRRLAATCKFIDNLLSGMEHALHSATSKAVFPRYAVDVSSAEARVIEAHILQVRSQLLRALDWQRMKPEAPEIPVTGSILADLSFVDNAIEELKPAYLRSFGPVPADAVAGLNEAIHDLRSSVKEMERYLRSELRRGSEAEL